MPNCSLFRRLTIVSRTPGPVFYTLHRTPVGQIDNLPAAALPSNRTVRAAPSSRGSVRILRIREFLRHAVPGAANS
jgi:hypothetical protein